MPSFGVVARRVLNLPDPKPNVSQPGNNPAEQPASAPTVNGVRAQGANPWTAAGQQLRALDAAARATTAPAPEAGESRPPWHIEEERGFNKIAARFGRGLLWAVVVLAAVTGVRSWIWPRETPAPAPATTKSGPAYPVQDAQAVAARWARAYLSWTETDPQARAQALAMDMPQGTDTALGWDGKGQQSVLVAQPGAVTTPAAEPSPTGSDTPAPLTRADGSTVPPLATATASGPDRASTGPVTISGQTEIPATGNHPAGTGLMAAYTVTWPDETATERTALRLVHHGNTWQIDQSEDVFASDITHGDPARSALTRE
ncbi:MAG: hypothetical protein JWN15_4302 [Firmicutes bacterium]|nr:hypothetical protein [Bacillota bacterium]